MYIDPFTKQSIYQEHIWDSSQCIWQENTVTDFFRHLLISQGYQKKSPNNKVFQKDGKTIVICLVDDIASCSDSYDMNTPYLYDTNTLIITDNYVSCPTQYKVLQLPTSFFGIYSHNELLAEWQPCRDYTLAINRLDFTRLEIFLEILKHADIDVGHVNFNCFQHNNTDGKLNFENQWAMFSDHQQRHYQSVFDKIKNLVPIRNYNFEHELSYYRSYLNITVETYSGDNTIALSEKTFRTLTTPAPWTLFAGRHVVAYLKSIGFDVLDDQIDHSKYDELARNQLKVQFFANFSHASWNKIKTMDFTQIKTRCNQAAKHNQLLLQKMKNSWATDLIQWLPQLKF